MVLSGGIFGWLVLFCLFYITVGSLFPNILHDS